MEALQVSLGTNTWNCSVGLPLDGHIYMKMSIPSSTLAQWCKAIIWQVLWSFEILHFKSSAPPTILPNHQLSGVQSSTVVMLSQQLLKCNNCSFLLWCEVTMRRRGRKKRISRERVREYFTAIWHGECTHAEMREKSWDFVNIVLCGCKEMQRWHFFQEAPDEW